MSYHYNLFTINALEKSSATVFICADGDDERAYAMANALSKVENKIQKIVAITYQPKKSLSLDLLFPHATIETILITTNTFDFLFALRKLDSFLCSADVLIDISCIRIPEMFTLLKYFRVAQNKTSLDISYSVPFEYEFPNEPFTSYRSYYGNLETTDLPGFGGFSDGTAHSQMIVFLGFEGVLSSKVTEDIQYGNLLLLNNLPSFFPKYKDTSVINNYDLLSSRHKLMYVPANNPFETYNLLDEILENDENACIAPLSTKPVALGVCLYAMKHPNIRVVYPVSSEYNHHNANSVLQTYIYQIPLFF